MLFWVEDVSLCAADVVCLQERVGYLEVRDWEEVQMRKTLFFLLNGSFYAHKTAPHVVRIVTAGLTRRVKRFLQPSNVVAFKE